MTDNQDDFDVADDFGQADDAPAQGGLAALWKGNPLVKVGAVVLGGTVLVSGFLALMKPSPVEEAQSVVAGPDASTVKVAPGSETLDKKYIDAVQERNKQRADNAAASGASAIPTPIAPVKEGLDIPQAAPDEGSDPLKEWKKNIAARRVKTNEDVVEDIAPIAPLPEIVPLVQPVRPQPTVKADPQAAAALAAQARTIIGTQVPTKAKVVSVTSAPSAYTKMMEAQDAGTKPARAGQAGPQAQSQYGAAGNQQQPTLPPGMDKVIIPAGQIVYAQLLTELNSDIPAPALATILSGPFAGGRVIGNISSTEEYIVINFTRIIKDDVSYTVTGIALDESTTLPAQRTKIDHHYFSRIILPAAAKFVEGYGSAVAETGTTTTTTAGGGVVSSKPKPDAKESLYKGLEESSGTLSDVIEEGSKRKPTIHIARGTTMGILFLETVKTSSVEP